MKKVFIIAVALLGFGSVSAQKISYGATAGFHQLGTSTKISGQETVNGSLSGYYFGVFADFNVGEKFNVQPEINYASGIKDGESINELIIPIMAKYAVYDKLNIQVGPQLDYVLTESANLNKFGLGLAFGAGYDFSEKIFASARYSLGLTNRLKTPLSDSDSSKFSTFQIGIGYRF